MRRIAALLAVSLLAASVLYYATAADERGSAPVPARPALTVTTVMPDSVELALRLEAHGNIVPWQEAVIGAEAAGLRITEVRVNVGDRVKRGQVLATLARETPEAELAQQEAAVRVAEAEFAEAQANAGRRRTLAASGAASAQEVGQYLTAEKSAEARLESARAAARAARVRLANTRVLASGDGVISGRSATVGAVTQPAQELFRMIRDNRLEWRAEVTAADLARVRVGQRVALFLPGGATASGKVRMLAPTVDLQTRNALVYVDVTGSAARAGMFARGQFELGRSGALTLPQQAVVLRDGFSYVFTVGPDLRVSQVRVKTGRREDDRVEIVEGLARDAAVVAAGAGFLNDGDVVAVAPAEGRAP